MKNRSLKGGLLPLARVEGKGIRLAAGEGEESVPKKKRPLPSVPDGGSASGDGIPVGGNPTGYLFYN